MRGFSVLVPQRWGEGSGAKSGKVPVQAFTLTACPDAMLSRSSPGSPQAS